MLKHLHIENYVLIDKLEIDFDDGLTVITGETGAGKSILLGALALILGQRADSQVIRDKSRKCIIEGHFDVSNAGLENCFQSHQLDLEPVSIIRREITPQGKSRAFVNDTPVTLQVLKENAQRNTNINSQHKNMLISESSFQFDVLDSYAGMLSTVADYQTQFASLQKQKSDLANLENLERQSRTDLDYYRFQYEELEKSSLNKTAYQEWENELELLRHAGEIKYNLEAAGYNLVEKEMNVETLLYDTIQKLKPLSKFSDDYAKLGDRLASVLIEIKDVAADTTAFSSQVTHDPGKAEDLEMKIDQVNRLMLKHHVTDIADLIHIRDEYADKINSVESLDQQIMALREAIEKVEAGLFKLARSISQLRNKAIPQIEKSIRDMLRQLGMPGGKLHIEQLNGTTLTTNGLDRIRFLFSANPGSEPDEIGRIASGGELSRLMLCVKSMLSEKKMLPSIIFDEIDTGISGEVGGKIGDIMLSMANDMQVIAITHLPQIAAKGHHHMLVYKRSDKGTTNTFLKKLDREEQIDQIAKMLGGDQPTASMYKTAEDLKTNK